MRRSSLPLVLLLVATSLAAADPLARPPVVEAAVPWLAETTVPVQVTIRSDTTRRITVRVMATDRDAHQAQADWQVAGETTRTLLLPRPANDWYHLTLDWSTDDGFSDRMTFPGRHDQALVHVIDPDRTLDQEALTSRRLVSGLAQAASSRLTSSSRASLVAVTPLHLLPDRWQGYPAGALILAPGATRRLDAVHRDALTAWVQAGGILALPEGPDRASWTAAGVTTCTLDQPPPEAIAALSRRDLDLRLVPGTGEVPALTFVLVSLVFVVVAGPLNFWWFLRRRQRQRLLVSIPAIGLAGTVLLFVFSLLSEGLSLRRSVDQFLWLDGTRHQATTWTGITYYAPFAIRTLRLDAETAVAVLQGRDDTIDYHHRRSPSEDRTLDLGFDWREGLLATGTWVPTRENRRLVYIRPAAERQRLILTAVGDGYAVINGLDVAIRFLEWNDAAGRRWLAKDLAPGAEMRLHLAPVAETTGPASGPGGGPQALPGTALRTWLKAGREGQHVRCQLAGPATPLPGPEGAMVEGFFFLAGPLTVTPAGIGAAP